tara:strand:- start:317 stop:517 length:201 start_codon:yes stop_codon:yes gene_type:complete
LIKEIEMTKEKKVILSEEEAMALQNAIHFVRFGLSSETYIPLRIIKSFSLLEEKMVESGMFEEVAK